jgi:hypothetical protein
MSLANPTERAGPSAADPDAVREDIDRTFVVLNLVRHRRDGDK